jgi:hypothetical protein
MSSKLIDILTFTSAAGEGLHATHGFVVLAAVFGAVDDDGLISNLIVPAIAAAIMLPHRSSRDPDAPTLSPRRSRDADRAPRRDRLGGGLAQCGDARIVWQGPMIGR